MNDNEINIAIAEACGWKRLGNGLFANPAFHGRKLESDLPDYTADLNAMHGAWLTLEKYGRARMSHYLGRIKNDAPHWECENATARQRAEAFLRTLGKWKD